MGHDSTYGRTPVPFIGMPFRPRHTVPRVCVLDDKPHVRTFISDMLDDLGFITESAPQAIDIRALLRTVDPALVVLSVAGAQERAPGILIKLAAEGFQGKVMLFGGRASPALQSTHELGEKLRLAMLPPLGTPFHDAMLAENLAGFLPIRPAVATPIDVAEALDRDWLELWYQPKIDPHRMILRGAEALIRMRHPSLGVVPPAYFIPSHGDPQLRALSVFVIERAAADWRMFADGDAPIELAINLPLALLSDSGFVDDMRDALPDHPAFPGLTVEVDSSEIAGDPMTACHTARHLADFNIRMAIGDAASACAPLSSLTDVPIVELKLDWTLIQGCTDALKQAVCAPVVEQARRFRASAVAVGIETAADLEAVRGLGFNLVQGYLFARPMDARKFARTMLTRRGVAMG